MEFELGSITYTTCLDKIFKSTTSMEAKMNQIFRFKLKSTYALLLLIKVFCLTSPQAKVHKLILTNRRI